MLKAWAVWSALLALWPSAQAVAVTPQSGLWIVAAENDGRPGRGLQLDVRGADLVATVYAYTSTGEAQWYLASGRYDGSDFSGTLQRYAGGTAFGGAPIAAMTAGSAGSLQLHFDSATTGLVTLPGEPARAISKVQFGALPTQAADFHGSLVLAAPTGSSIQATVLSTDQNGTLQLVYGTAPGLYPGRSATVTLQAGAPVRLRLEGLAANTRYYYRYLYSGGPGAGIGPEGSFQTARPPDSSFTFTLQADSHLDENADLDQYRQTLANILADGADFHLDLGDTFMCEKHSAPLTAVLQRAPDQATVDARYGYEHANFARFAGNVPLLLVNGNHEGEAGWLNSGNGNNIAIWSTRARQRYYANPVPDGFYSGDSVNEADVGQRAAWYAWQWGDALFVVLDPYWHSARSANSDGWNLTLGERQYRWLEQTLAGSSARFKFVFLHNLVGGLDGQMRGGIEAAPYYEWGGRNADGSDGFAAHRPGWARPIHALLLQYGVSAVLHGHDHLYARQMLDGIVYLEVPQPSARNFQSGASLAEDYHYTSGTILSSSGHVRIRVTPSAVTGEYVRAWLPRNENATRRNGQVDDRWTLSAPGN